MSKLNRAKKLIGKTIKYFDEPVKVIDVSFYPYPAWETKKGLFFGARIKGFHGWSSEAVVKLSARLNIMRYMYNFDDINQETGEFTKEAKMVHWETFNFPEKYPGDL